MQGSADSTLLMFQCLKGQPPVAYRLSLAAAEPSVSSVIRTLFDATSKTMAGKMTPLPRWCDFAMIGSCIEGLLLALDPSLRSIRGI